MLPAAWRARLEQRPNVLQILSNTGWLVADRVLRMAVGLLVGVWVARYLGPEQFGLLSYVMAIVSVFTAIGSLGLDNVVVRELVRNPNAAEPTLGTCIVLQIAGSTLALSLAVATVSLLRPEDTLARTAVAVLALAIVFKSTDAIRFWFESRVQAKHVVWAESSAFAAFALIKVMLVVAGAPLMSFVWAVPAEAGLAALLMIATYTRQGRSLRMWRFEAGRARSLLKNSFPLILSALAAMIYMRIDQIMLGEMAGDQDVGIYSAAVRISEVWYFIPMAIGASVFPAILVARQTDTAVYHAHLQRLFSLMTVLALVTAVPVTLFAEEIIRVLYGDGFPGAADILVVHVWTGLFVFHGVAGSRWFLAENLQGLMMFRTLAGCLASVLLNLYLIPRYGALGSAWASVGAQAVAAMLVNALHPRTRILFVMQLKALVGSSLFTRHHAVEH